MVHTIPPGGFFSLLGKFGIEIAGVNIVLGDQQDFQRVGDGFGQRHLRRVPVASAQEGEVLALLERHQADTRKVGKTVEAEVVSLRVGDFRLVTFPAELTVEVES